MLRQKNAQVTAKALHWLAPPASYVPIPLVVKCWERVLFSPWLPGTNGGHDLVKAILQPPEC